MKIYPSKRVKNHAAKKLRKIFGICGKVVLKHADSIYLTGDRCYGLHYGDLTKSGLPIHRIIISEELNRDMRTYMATLMHEYVHARQYEEGKNTNHGRYFKKWAKYIESRYNVKI